MKIGVIADTHIPKNAERVPAEVLKIFRGVDLILHAGDLTDLTVLDELRQITPRVEAVLGNMDPAGNRAQLPVKKIVNANGVRIVLMHGSGAPLGLKKRIWQEVKEEKPQVVIFGHSHQPEKDIINDILFLNPGSPTDKFFTSVNAVAILKIEGGKVDAEIVTL